MYLFLSFLMIFNLALSSAQAGEKTVLVFGCFDLLHEGHKNFLSQASNYGRVIAIITPDAIVAQLKRRSPVQCQEIRMNRVEESGLVCQVLLGDKTLGRYQIFDENCIDLICLGYDQTGLFKDLKMRMEQATIPTIPMIFLEPYQENRYHTSLIREQLNI